MLYKVDTSAGQIVMDRSVIGQIVLKQIEPFYGRVWVTNSKGTMGGIVNRLGGRSEMDDLDISMDAGGISVRIHLIIRFGVSIRTVTEQILADIRSALETYTELPVRDLTVVVTGTLSKHIARRNIEIKG